VRKLTTKVLKNPTAKQIEEIIIASKHKAARALTDCRNGDIYVWDAAEATHREAADHLGIPYDKKPGQGDILTL
jgi:threonyl-tRNA synthetase